MQFLNSSFQEESFKDRLRETLKELNTCTRNEEGVKGLCYEVIKFWHTLKQQLGMQNRMHSKGNNI
jgi:hypothetical protein